MYQKMDSCWKRSSSFQSFHFILDKWNTITVELIENQTVKYHPHCRRDLTNDAKLNRILKQITKEKEQISTEITAELQQGEPSYIKICRKSKEIMKEETCFAWDKKTKRKRRSRHLEKLSRVVQDNGPSNFHRCYEKEWRFIRSVITQCCQAIESYD